MWKPAIGIDNVARAVKKIYIGVDGVARQVATAYIGVNGVARVFYGGFYIPKQNETVLSLAQGGYLYSADSRERKLMSPGRYKVSVDSGVAAFEKEVVVSEPFYMVGFCRANLTVLTDFGFNTLTGIFGGRKGSDAGVIISGGGGRASSGALAGSCLHFVPYDGNFIQNYFYCFHAGLTGDGAYGGGAGGRGARVRNSMTGSYSNYTGGTGYAGAGGKGGTGGTGTINGQPGAGTSGNPGNPGTGIGHGTATTAGAAFFNGSTWSEPTRKAITSPHITVIYLGES